MSILFNEYHRIRLLLCSATGMIAISWGDKINSPQHAILRAWGLPSSWRRATFPQEYLDKSISFVQRAIDGMENFVGETADTVNHERASRDVALDIMKVAVELMEEEAREAIDKQRKGT